MSNVGIDTWNLISGMIGVLTVLPFIWAFVRYQHPESKMAELESALKDTECLIHSTISLTLPPILRGALSRPLLPLSRGRYRYRYCMKTEALREETFIVSVSWRKALVAWSQGLSKRISILCGQVKKTRAGICETSAEQRMRLMNEDAEPSYCTWRARILNFWERMASVFYRSPAAETADTASQRSPTPAVDPSAASTDDSDTRRASNKSHREASSYRSKPRRSPSRMLRVAADSRDLRMLTSAIRRIDRDLTAQGISHVLLTQLAQTTRKQWSPASTRAHRPRSRQSRGARPGPGPNDAVPSRHARQPSIDSNTYTSGEETACEV